MSNNIITPYYYWLLLLFSFSIFPMDARALKSKDSITVFEVYNKRLLVIMDSIIGNEKKCNYYKEELPFCITVRKYKNLIYVTIEATDANIGSENPYIGCIKRGKHLFFIRGKYDKSLFVRRNERLNLDAFQVEKRSDGYVYYENDSYSTYLYKYIRNKFYYISHFSYCK